MPRSRFETLQSPDLMKRDSLDDLMCFEPVESWQDRQSFLGESLRRLERGGHCYTRVESGRLVHFGWLHEQQKESHFPEVGQRLILAPGTAVLYDFYTHPEARGKGLYKAAIAQILHDVKKISGVENAFIAALAANQPSCRAIERLGFEYTFSLYRSVAFGREKKWASDLPEGWSIAADKTESEGRVEED